MSSLVRVEMCSQVLEQAYNIEGLIIDDKQVNKNYQCNVQLNLNHMEIQVSKIGKIEITSI